VDGGVSCCHRPSSNSFYQHKIKCNSIELTIENHALIFVKFILLNVTALGVMMRMVLKPSSGSI